MENNILDEIENEDLYLKAKGKIIIINFVIALIMILSGIIICIKTYDASRVSDYSHLSFQSIFGITFLLKMSFGLFLTIDGYLLFIEKRFGLQLMYGVGWLIIAFSIYILCINIGNFWGNIYPYGGFLLFGIVLLFYSNWKKLDWIFE